MFFPSTFSKTGAILWLMNNEIATIMTNYTHLYKELKKNKREENLRKKRILEEVRIRICGKCALGIFEYVCYTRSVCSI